MIIGQLVLVIALVAAINRIPVGLATVLFLLYSATVGITFAFIFELYTTQSIFTAFLITAGMFGALAVWGAITDIDLTKVGSIAFMALIGLILATIVNIFWANETLYWVTTYAGVLIFAALTAYDMQKLTQISSAGPGGRGRGPRGDHRRPLPLPRLHQPLPLPAADLRPEPLGRGGESGEPSRGRTAGRAAGGASAPRTCSPTTTASGAGSCTARSSCSSG